MGKETHLSRMVYTLVTVVSFCLCMQLYVFVYVLVDGTVVCSGGGSVLQPKRDPLPSIVIDICEGVYTCTYMYMSLITHLNV